MLPGCSFMSDGAVAVAEVGGGTQASRVMPVVRSRLLVSGMVTEALVPLKASACPYLLVVVQVALVRVPLLPVPDWSGAVVPLPVSKP